MLVSLVRFQSSAPFLGARGCAARLRSLHSLALRQLAPFRSRLALPCVPLPSEHFTCSRYASSLRSVRAWRSRGCRSLRRTSLARATPARAVPCAGGALVGATLQ